MTKEELKTFISKWQVSLKLRDWEIEADVDPLTPYANISMEPQVKRAIITINGGREEEVAIIKLMLHLHLSPSINRSDVAYLIDTVGEALLEKVAETP
jgi:hypothetical protein